MNIVKAYLSMCYALQASLNLYTLHFSFFITIFNLSELQILIWQIVDTSNHFFSPPLDYWDGTGKAVFTSEIEALEMNNMFKQTFLLRTRWCLKI